MAALPRFSDDRALDLRVVQRELNRSKIAHFLMISVASSCGANVCHRSMDQDRPL